MKNGTTIPTIPHITVITIIGTTARGFASPPAILFFFFLFSCCHMTSGYKVGRAVTKFSKMEDGRGCILLLCGIPGSGKTTLARKIKDYIQFSRATSLHVLHICFDDLIPSNLDLKEQIAFEEFGLPCQSQSSKTQTSHSNSVIVDIQEGVCNRLHTENGVVASSHFVSPWKTYRNRILTLTDGLITALKDRDDHDKKKIQHTDTSNVLVEQLMKLKELNGGVNSKCGTSFEQFLSDFTGMLSSPDKGCECSTVQTRTQRWVFVNTVRVVHAPVKCVPPGQCGDLI